jgi:hypothetical protein
MVKRCLRVVDRVQSVTEMVLLPSLSPTNGGAVLTLLVLAALAVAWFSLVSVYRLFQGEV